MTTRITTNRARVFASALFGALLAMPAAVHAQAQSAVITGKVTSEFGQPIDQANVYINDVSISVPTNAQGVYTITIACTDASGNASTKTTTVTVPR